jgi:hypothetical protein
MYFRHDRIRLADDDHRDTMSAPSRRLPQPGKGERLEILAAEAGGLLAVGTFLRLLMQSESKLDAVKRTARRY